jgi:hypothetical protein
MVHFKRIQLFEEVEIALITSFQGLVGFPTLINIGSALRATMRYRNEREKNFKGGIHTSRRHEFLAALNECQCSSCPTAISQLKSLDFSSSVQCLEPWVVPSSYSEPSSASRLRFSGVVVLMNSPACLRLRVGEVVVEGYRDSAREEEAWIDCGDAGVM